MTSDRTIRPERPADRAAVSEVNRLAFGREGEAQLVDALRDGGFVRLSLVAEASRRIVGHILFSEITIQTDAGSLSALALAPVAVLPTYQRKGIGSDLIQHGLADCRTAGHRIVLVLGEPVYYRRIGFRTESAANLKSPFPPEYFMAFELTAGALQDVHGEVIYPPPFSMDLPPA